MKRHAKAASAGSTSGRGNGLGSIRRAFATRGALGDGDGSGAPSGHLFLVFLGAIAVLLTLGVGFASAKAYEPGTPASFCTGTGTAAGECGEVRGVAVDTSNGNVYIVDQGNNRVDQFAPNGSFVRAFGSAVADGTTAAAQVCTTTCFKGFSSAGIAGGLGAAAKGIAVDPETHVVYVASAAARLAYYNGSTGAFIGQTEGSANQAGSPTPPNINAGTPETLGATTGVAVDTSNPLQHYLYVAAAPGGITKIDKFKISASGVTAGSYVCQITGTATDTSADHSECGGNGVTAHKDGAFEGLELFGQNGGHLAVDASGNVFIAESVARSVVSEFDKNGNYVTQFKPTVTGHPSEPRPEAVATLSNGNLLVADDGPFTGGGGSVVQEFKPSEITPAVPPAIASASALSEFGSGTIGDANGGSVGLATVGSSVFAGGKANKKIWKFSPTPVPPTISTEAATALTKTRATLHGKVNPNLANVSDCHFEYGATTSYGSTAPCAPSPGSGADPVSVSATISGLTLGTTYHFRLVATNTVGTSNGSDLEFTTTLLNKPEVTTTPGATQIAQTTAKVAGTVNPNESLVTDCHINYGTTVAYGSTASCTPSPGSGETPVNVSASLSGLGLLTTYHFQVVATNGDGTTEGSDQQFTTLSASPSLSTPTIEVGQIAAKVVGTVNPNSSNITDCHVDFGPTTAYGSSASCVPSPGSGSSPVGISASLISLTPGTAYHFRLVATSATGGTTTGVDQAFVTLAPNPPSALTDNATDALGSTFSLEGRINPEGLAVSDCHFAYGPTSEYGRTAPCIPSVAGLGTGSSDVAVTTSTEPLEPNTVYHFRLFASNSRGTSKGKDRTFTTGAAPADSCPNADIRAAQGVEVGLLPDCMALEQVSPSKKANQSARRPVAITPDDGGVLFNATATLGDCPHQNGITGDEFVAVRDQSLGWKTECSPNADPEFFAPDLSQWFRFDVTQVFSDVSLGGSPVAISPPLPNLTGPSSPRFVGSSEDHSLIYFMGGGGSTRNDSFLPGDPLPAGEGEDRNLYVTGLDSNGNVLAELATRDRDGKVWGGNCGARLGGFEDVTGGNLNLPNGRRNQGAISPDGSRVYFSTRSDQPSTGDCTEANKKRIVVREETPTGPKIEELVSPECDRISPPCSVSDGDDIYQGASVDQSKVYFTTTRQLADSDLDDSGGAACVTNSPPQGEPQGVTGCDLYLYDSEKPAGERLTQVSGGDSTDPTPGSGARVVNSITGISADGSHAYFVALGILTADSSPAGNTAVAGKPNLYAWDAASETTSFIGTLASGAASGANDGGFGGTGLWGSEGTWSNAAYPVPITRTDAHGNQVGGDGHILLFKSKAKLTPDDTDAAIDIYRYDAEANTLELVSKAAPGGSDNGAFDVQTINGGSVGTNYAELGRWASEDGDVVVFTSKEALLPGDTNGAEDSFLWRHGQLYHLPGSTRSSASAGQILPVLSHDGSTLAYHSTKQLISSDGDSVEDVYALRVDGGYRNPVRPVCEGEACQGSPGTLSGEIGATTGALASAGNVKAQETLGKRRCPKGKHRVRRKGEARCVPQRSHSHKRQAKKRAGNKQGGQK